MPFIKIKQFDIATQTLRSLCKCGPKEVLVLKHTGDVVAIKGGKPYSCLVFAGQEKNIGIKAYKKPLEIKSKYLEKDTPRELMWLPAEKVYNIINNIKEVN